jgi:hypothetical protein
MSEFDQTQEASSRPQERRAVVAMTTGAKLSVLAALLLVVFMAFLMLSPISRADTSAKTVDCGTVLNPPPTDFVRGLCGQANDMRLAQTVAVGAAALIVGVGGIMTFGTTRRENLVPDDDDDQDD